ncbi:hypothetical protein GCM10029976_097110 [Kribbella albertanoniae]|uniref:Uncharacterized protein n=1 Tax=Kribbella albertanoniae TaxID=1266829 RepID=A0A4R4PLF7_9ACTN|nr:hypothetical protein [Kribbella albertanoniae]TDC22957.1 hypothetical protein E1261_29600 [Kribbella albertanoniae]
MEFAIFVVIMIVAAIVGAAKKQRGSDGTPSPRVQKLIERIQAQQGGNQPIQFQGQFTQPQGQPGPVQGQVSGSQQAGAALQALMQAGRQHAHPGEWTTPGQAAAPQQYQPAPYQPGPYQPAPYQPGPYQPGYQAPATWLPTHQQPYQQPSYQQQSFQQRGPTPKPNLDNRVRELMQAGNEVGAVRLLSDERDLGLLEAQQYARSLVAPATDEAVASSPAEEETRYVGSAAIAESMFNLDPDEDTWASGWVDTPEPEDRTDIDELWQTVSNPPRSTGAP